VELEDEGVNVQKWVSFFSKTLFIGAFVYLIIGSIVQRNQLAASFHNHWPATLIQLFVLMVFGGMFSVLSQMGFFAYLTLHRIAVGMLRSHALWGKVQLVLIAFTFFDLFYFRFTVFSKQDESVLSDVLLPVILLAVSLIVAFIKKRATNAYAFIPTLFFMFVITVLEWLVGLFQHDLGIVWVIGITLIMCNGYQVLTLHKLTIKDKPTG
jgi:KinB signaling pathway activation protein